MNNKILQKSPKKKLLALTIFGWDSSWITKNRHCSSFSAKTIKMPSDPPNAGFVRAQRKKNLSHCLRARGFWDENGGMGFGKDSLVFMGISFSLQLHQHVLLWGLTSKMTPNTLGLEVTWAANVNSHPKLTTNETEVPNCSHFVKIGT